MLAVVDGLKVVREDGRIENDAHVHEEDYVNGRGDILHIDQLAQLQRSQSAGENEHKRYKNVPHKFTIVFRVNQPTNFDFAESGSSPQLLALCQRGFGRHYFVGYDLFFEFRIMG